MAEKGDAKAQCEIGFMYAEGRGVPKNPDEAIKWYLKAAQQGYGLGHRRLADAYRELGQIIKAEEHYLKALTAAKAHQDKKQEVHILDGLGTVYLAKKQSEKAKAYFRQGLVLSRELKDRKAESLFLYHIATAHAAANQHDKARELYDQCVTIQRQTKDKGGMLATLFALANECAATGQYARSADLFQEGLDLARQGGNKELEARILYKLPGVYGKVGQRDKELATWKAILAMPSVMRDKQQDVAALRRLGRLYEERHEYRDALDYYEKGLNLSKDTRNEKLEVAILCDLGLCYNKQGQHDRALSYWEYAMELKRFRAAIDGSVSPKKIQRRKELAEQGDPTAQSRLSYDYFFGRVGGNRDLKQAFKWRLAAAHQGYYYSPIGLVHGYYYKILVERQQELEAARRNGDRETVREDEFALGLLYDSMGQHFRAIEFIQQSFEAARQAGDVKTQNAALSLIGAIYVNTGQPLKALEVMENSLAITRRRNDIGWEVRSLRKMGEIYSALGDHAKAVGTYELALSRAKAIGDTELVKGALNDLENHYDFGMKDRPRQLDYLYQLLVSCREAKDTSGEVNALSRIGRLFRAELGDPKKALETYDEAMKAAERLPDNYKEKEAIARDIVGIHRAAGRIEEVSRWEARISEWQARLTESKRLHEPELKVEPRNDHCHDKERDIWTLMEVANYFRWTTYENHRAVECYQRALELVRLADDPGLEGRILEDIAEASKDQSLELRKRAVEIWVKIGDSYGAGRGLEAIANRYSKHHSCEKALEYRRQALEVWRSSGSRDYPTSCLALAEDLMKMRQTDRARMFVEESLNWTRNSGDSNLDIYCLQEAIKIYALSAQYERALEVSNAALVVCRRVHDIRNEVRMLEVRGHIYAFSGNWGKALETYLEMETVASHRGGADETRKALAYVAYVYEETGQYQKAQEAYDKALNLSKGDSPADDTVSDQMFLGLASVYQRLGRYDRASDLYERAVTIPMLDLGALRRTTLYERLGEFRKAIETWKQWLKEIRGDSEFWEDSHPEAICLQHLSRLHSQLGEYDVAERYAGHAMAILKKLELPSDEVNAVLGEIYLDQGKVKAAEPYIRASKRPASLGRLYLAEVDAVGAKQEYETLLRKAEESGDVDDLFTAYMGLAKAYELMENYQQAENHYDRAMKLVEEIRSTLPSGQRKYFYEVRINGFSRLDPAQGLTRVRMKMNRAGQSVDSSEVTRARLFAEKMAERTASGYTGVPRDILEKEDSLVNAVAGLKQTRGKTVKRENPERWENLTRQIEKAEKDLHAFVEMLWKDHTAYASVKYPRPVTLKESALRPQEHVIIFDVSDEGVGIKLLKGKEIAETHFNRWKLADLEADVKRFRKCFDDVDLKAFDTSLAKMLYKRLLGRVLMEVPEGTPVTIIPDGILAVLPFEALVTEGRVKWKEDGEFPVPGGLTYVADMYPISYYQSITALSLARTLGIKDKPGEKLLVMADPVFEPTDPRLTHAGENVKLSQTEPITKRLMSIKDEIGVTFPRLALTGQLAKTLKRLAPEKTDLFSGAKAEKAVLLDHSLIEYGSMVFATHGYFGKMLPGIMEPVLVLTLVDQPPERDGFLRMTEVMGLKLNADIVALTACQTGVGRLVSGEGTMNMGRAFQYAGARSVLMSLWSVAQRSSVQLTENFFRHMKEGKGKLEALKMARDEIRKAGYDHPFFWAPFILVGETN